MLGIKDMDPSDKYLGDCIQGGVTQKNLLWSLINKAGKKLQGWHAKHLSIVGCNVLIKHSLATINYYSMSTTLLPIEVHV